MDDEDDDDKDVFTSHYSMSGLLDASNISPFSFLVVVLVDFFI